jgi:hypothetical protein
MARSAMRNWHTEARNAHRLAGLADMVTLLLAFSTRPAAAQYYDPYGRYERAQSFLGRASPDGGPSIVSFPAHYKPGTILISTSRRRR